MIGRLRPLNVLDNRQNPLIPPSLKSLECLGMLLRLPYYPDLCFLYHSNHAAHQSSQSEAPNCHTRLGSTASRSLLLSNKGSACINGWKRDLIGGKAQGCPAWICSSRFETAGISARHRPGSPRKSVRCKSQTTLSPLIIQVPDYFWQGALLKRLCGFIHWSSPTNSRAVKCHGFASDVLRSDLVELVRGKRSGLDLSVYSLNIAM